MPMQRDRPSAEQSPPHLTGGLHAENPIFVQWEVQLRYNAHKAWPWVIKLEAFDGYKLNEIDVVGQWASSNCVKLQYIVFK